MYARVTLTSSGSGGQSLQRLLLVMGEHLNVGKCTSPDRQ